MYLTINKKNMIKIAKRTVFFYFSIFILWDIIVLSLLVIVGADNYLSFLSLNNKSQLSYIVALIIVIIAFISLKLLNKNNWPMVQARIYNSLIVRNNSSISRTWILKHVYTFDFNGEKIVKTANQMEPSFKTQEEANNYLMKFRSNNKKILNIYVFTPYPKIFSSQTKKVNILYLFYMYTTIVSTILLLLYGFVFSLANLGYVSIIPFKEGGYQYGTPQDLHNLLAHITAPAVMLSFLLPLSLLIALLIYFILTIKLMYRNKMYFVFSSIDEIFPDESYNADINKVICLKCTSKNEETSVFCTNCGASLKF